MNEEWLSQEIRKGEGRRRCFLKRDGSGGERNLREESEEREVRKIAWLMATSILGHVD